MELLLQLTCKCNLVMNYLQLLMDSDQMCMLETVKLD